VECGSSLSPRRSRSTGQVEDKTALHTHPCPVKHLKYLVNAIANGSSRCNAETLNAMLCSWNEDNAFISDQVQDYCVVFLIIST
jgi:hypothetical protein